MLLLEPRARSNSRFEPANVRGHHPFRAFADRLPAYRRRAHGFVQLALRQAHDGKFLLRIEDTDRERSTQAAVDAILDGLKWLGLNWDGEAISQFKRAERHREVAEQLLASGGAYRCYASVEELEQMREKARLEGKPMRYDGRWRDRDPAEAPAGVKPVDPPARRARRARPSSTTRCRARSSSPTRISTTSCFCARTAIRPTCSRSSSTITTWG